MTIDISNNIPRIEYTVAEGVEETSFEVPFEFFSDSDINVYVDGVLKTITTDYDITGGDGSTGQIDFVVATEPDIQQVTGATGGSVVIITRHIPIERVTDFPSGIDINRAALNTQFDTVIGMIADVNTKSGRALSIADSEVATSLVLPSIANRAGRVLSFNSSTGAVEAGNLNSLISDNTAQTAADRVQTGLDVIATNADAVATAADRVQTGLDAVQTGLDAVATAADRVQTGLDADRAGISTTIGITQPVSPRVGDAWVDTTTDIVTGTTIYIGVTAPTDTTQLWLDTN